MTLVFDGILLLCIILTGTSLVSMMGVFIGSTQPALNTLLTVQAYATIPAALVFIVAIAVFVWTFGFVEGWRQIWRRTPHWLIFVFVSVNSLVIAGELSYLLIHTLSDKTTPVFDHVPLASALFGSLAYCAVYAWARWRTP